MCSPSIRTTKNPQVGGYTAKVLIFVVLLAVQCAAYYNNKNNNVALQQTPPPPPPPPLLRSIVLLERLATLPYTYMCAYCVSQPHLHGICAQTSGTCSGGTPLKEDYQRGFFFYYYNNNWYYYYYYYYYELDGPFDAKPPHGGGSLGLLYAILVWYKLVVQRANNGLPHPVARAVAAASALCNMISGIGLFPHISRHTPLGHATGLYDWHVHGVGNHHDPRHGTMCGLQRQPQTCGLTTTTTTVNKKSTTTSAAVEDPTTSAPTLVSFFYDVFLYPDKYGALKSKATGTSSHVTQPVNQLFMTIPGMVMGLIAWNLAAHRATIMPLILNGGVGGEEEEEDGATTTAILSLRAFHYNIPTLEILALCISPANMFDLTLVLRKRMGVTRAAVEIAASIVLSQVASLPMAYIMLPPADCQMFLTFLQALMKPLMG
eukprot:scaffold4674_cov188-Amphora_coffeaeformis.AAC.8